MDEETEMYTYAVMSKAAYDHFENSQNFAQTNEELQKYLPEHELVEHFSDDHSVTIRHKTDPTDVTIAYRGTDGDVGDFVADAQVLLAKPAAAAAAAAVVDVVETVGLGISAAQPEFAPIIEPATDLAATYAAEATNEYGTNFLKSLGRFAEAERKYNQVSAAFPLADVKVTGHSLGGAQGAYINQKYVTRRVS